jgi:hypothetical protein
LLVRGARIVGHELVHDHLSTGFQRRRQALREFYVLLE